MKPTNEAVIDNNIAAPLEIVKRFDKLPHHYVNGENHSVTAWVERKSALEFLLQELTTAKQAAYDFGRWSSMKDIQKEKEIQNNEERNYLIEEEVTTAKKQILQEVFEKINTIISKYSMMKEVVINGQRFLKDDEHDYNIPFGYPYPDTREKYIIRDIKSIASSHGITIE